MVTNLLDQCSERFFDAIRRVSVRVNRVRNCYTLYLDVAAEIAPNWLDGLHVDLVSDDQADFYPCQAQWVDRTGSMLTAVLRPRDPLQPLPPLPKGDGTRYSPFYEVRLSRSPRIARMYPNATSARRFTES